MIPKVVLITGSYSPDICGVGDYSKLLFEEFNSTHRRYSLELMIVRDWSLFGFIKTVKSIFKRYDILHIQYPTEGYKYSLFPAALFALLWWKNRIVTIHEFSQRTLKAKLATSLFFFFSDQLIFTTEFERNNIIRFFPFVRKKSCVINIGSNIKSSKNKIQWPDRNFDLAYFGHFRPDKGLEDFKEIAKELFRIKNDYKIILIGQLQERFRDYFDSNFKHGQFEIFMNLEDNKVSDLLQNTKILLLPFPDGLSMRRGSFLAGIENGCYIVSYKGKFDKGLDNIAHLYSLNQSKIEIAKSINDILNNNSQRSEQEAISNFKANISWEVICNRHLQIYEK